MVSRLLLPQEVCSELNIEQSTLANYENNKRVPKIDILIKLAEYYNVSVDCLLGLKKVGTKGTCYDYFYEEGMANWNIRKKAKEVGLAYEEVLDKTDIPKERFDLLWFGNMQPFAEELIRFSEVLNVSIDYLLDNSQRERLTADEEIILLFYKKYPQEIMELLDSFCSLNKKDRTIILGKCFEAEQNSLTVSADMSSSKRENDKLGKSSPSSGTEGDLVG